MHELGIVQQVLEIAAERSGGAKIVRLTLEIGKLSMVMPEALRFAWDVATPGTAADGARLEIVETPGLGRCRGCGGEVPLETPLGRCACGGTDLDWLRGEELRIREMEVI